MQKNERIALLLLLFILSCLVAPMLFLPQDEIVTTHEVAPDKYASATGSDSESVISDRTEVGPEPRLADIQPALGVAGQTAHSKRNVRGWIGSSTTNAPLKATVRLGSSVVETDPRESGRFALQVIDPTNSDDCRYLVIQAECFEDRTVKIPDEGALIDLGRVSLVPNRHIGIRTIDQAGLSVSAVIYCVDHGDDYSAAPREIYTDGYVDIVVEGAVDLYARDAGNHVSRLVRWSPSGGPDELTLKITGNISSRIGLRSANRPECVGGVDLVVESLKGTQGLRIKTKTGSDGVLKFPIPPGRYRVSWDNLELTLVESSTVSAVSHNSGVARSKVLDTSLNSDIAWIDVSLRDSRQLQLLAPFGSSPPQSVVAWLRSRDDIGTLDWTEFGLPNALRVSGDTVLLAGINLNAVQSHPTITLAVYARGYRFAQVTDPVSAVPDGSTLPLVLEPAPLREVRLLNADGTPYSGHVVLYENRTRRFGGIKVADGWPDDNGSLGKFPWSGLDLAIVSDGFTVIEAVSASKLATESIIDVTLRSGSIIVAGPPTPAKLACRSMLGGIYESVVQQSTDSLPGAKSQEFLFAPLPPGDYLIGPRDLLTILNDPAAECVTKVTVINDQITRVVWQPSWDPPANQRITVQTQGFGPERLRVVPLFSRKPINVLRAGTCAGATADVNGEVLLEDLPAAPLAFAFFVNDVFGFDVPIAVREPASAYIVSAFSAVVGVMGVESTSLIRIELKPSLDTWPCQGVVSLVTSAGSNVMIDGLPGELRGIRISDGRRSQELPGRKLGQGSNLIECELR